jgi:hypothetical protein
MLDIFRDSLCDAPANTNSDTQSFLVFGTHCIYGVRMIPKINSDHFPKQH